MVLVLGYLGCMTTRSRMAEVYRAQRRPRAPTAYVVATSLAGTAALVSGVIAVVWAVESMLVVLVAATATLWLLATVRHLATAVSSRT